MVQPNEVARQPLMFTFFHSGRSFFNATTFSNSANEASVDLRTFDWL